jgi:hypothetical protein
MPHAASLLHRQALPLPLCAREVRVGVGVVGGVVVYVCVCLLLFCCLRVAGACCVGEVEFVGDTNASV